MSTWVGIDRRDWTRKSRKRHTVSEANYKNITSFVRRISSPACHLRRPILLSLHAAGHPRRVGNPFCRILERIRLYKQARLRRHTSVEL
jgi:hypothetical protein